MMRVPGCGRRGEAHRGNGHGGAPTAAGNRARNGGVYGGGALACAQRGRGGRGGPVGAQMREGEMASKARGSSGRGRGGGEFHARRGRGEGGREQLGRRLREEDGADNPGPRAERERGSGRARGKRQRRQVGPGEQREREAGARKAAAPTGRARCAERGGGRGARARWADWAERPRGAGKWAALPFSFILELFSPFLLFILFDSNSNEPQIQIRPFENYAPNKKVKSRVQHDATTHTPLGF